MPTIKSKGETEKFQLFCFLLLAVTGLQLALLTPNTVAQTKNVCSTKHPRATYELADSWVYICSENQELSYIQVNKSNGQTTVKLPAQGGNYTYAARKGEEGDPDTILYTIGPINLKVFKSINMLKSQPVIRVIDGNSGLVISTISGKVQTAANTACGKDIAVQVYETDSSWVYICIDGNNNNINATNLTYIQISKSHPKKQVKLPAELVNLSTYKTKSDSNSQHYTISNSNLEVWKENKNIHTEAVTHVYLKTPTAEIDTDAPQ